MADVSRILTGVKHIYFTPWLANDTGLDTSKRMELNSILADSVAISQNDNETNSQDCETRDEPITESVKLGKYTITMDSADINFDLLEACMGFTKVTTGSGSSTAYKAALAPTSYVKKYAQIEVEMDGSTFVLPRVLVTPKIDASSLKTGIAKGTLAGSGYSANVTIGSASSAVAAPFFVKAANVTHTVANLQSNSVAGDA